MFMRDVTKTPPYARNLVCSIFLIFCLFANGDVSIRFNGKDDSVVLELLFKSLILLIHENQQNAQEIEEESWIKLVVYIRNHLYQSC